MSQTTVSQYGAPAFKGMKDGIQSDYVVSLLAEGAVGISLPVVLGTNKETQAKAASSAVGQGALVVGFALHDHAREQSSAGLVQYGDKEAVSVLKRGHVWVENPPTIAAGSFWKIQAQLRPTCDRAADHEILG
jgi:hypothetical protein